MDQPGCEEVLKTVLNGVSYTFFKRHEVPKAFDNAAVSFQISTIRYFLREGRKLESLTISSYLLERVASLPEHACVQVVIPESHLTEAPQWVIDGAIYSAVGGGLCTITAVGIVDSTIPRTEVETRGTLECIGGVTQQIYLFDDVV
jgi:hypothetical protein